MKHFTLPDGTVRAFEADGSQDHLITEDMTPRTLEYVTALLAGAVQVPKAVTMRQARLALLQAGMLDAVNSAVAAMPGDAGTAARIEWEYSQEVQRDKQLVLALAPVLGLDEAQLDALFVAAAAL